MTSKSRWSNFAIFIGLFLAIFFAGVSDLRIALYKSRPYDDYSHQLEYFVTFGDSGHMSSSPRRERVISIAAFVPFSLLPEIKLSGGTGVAGERSAYYYYIVLGNVFYLLLLSAALYLIPKPGDKILFCTCIFLYSSYGGYTGVETFALIWMLAILLTERWSFFLALTLLIISIAVNEKILIALVPFYIIRFVFEKNSRNLVLSICGVLTFLAYITFRLITSEGHEEQISLNNGQKIIQFLSTLISAKGMILMASIPALFAIIALLCEDKTFRIGILFSLCWLMLSAIQGEIQYTTGRVALYVFPIIVAAWIRRDTNVNVEALPNLLSLFRTRAR